MADNGLWTIAPSTHRGYEDSLNSAAGGIFLDKMPRECLRIIESKSKLFAALITEVLKLRIDEDYAYRHDNKPKHTASRSPQGSCKSCEENQEVGFDSKPSEV
ncbi:hypothetical protein Tco_0163298 [Tanacetum coccineum]